MQRPSISGLSMALRELKMKCPGVRLNNVSEQALAVWKSFEARLQFRPTAIAAPPRPTAADFVNALFPKEMPRGR